MRNILAEYGYLLVLLVMISTAFIQRSKVANFQTGVIIILSGVYCFFYMFRDSSVGFDYKNYLDVYYYACNLPLPAFLLKCGYMETGYLIINKVIAMLQASIPIFQLSLAFFYTWTLYKYVISNSAMPLFSMFSLYGLGVYFNTMNQVRSTLAACICLIAIDHTQKKKWMSALIINAIACTIHTSAIVGFLLIILYLFNIKPNRKNIMRMLAALVTIGILFDRILILALKIFPRYAGYFAEDKIDRFIKQGSFNYILVFGAILVLALYCRRYIQGIDEEKARYYDLLVWSVCIGFALSILGLQVSMMLRFVMFSLIFCAPLLSEAISSIPCQKERLLTYTVTAVALIGYCYIYLYIAENGMGRDGIVPYAFMQ